MRQFDGMGLLGQWTRQQYIIRAILDSFIISLQQTSCF